MDQRELWRRVGAIKRHVRDQIGTELSHEFRSSNIYQGYTGLCGEAQIAYEAETLDEQIVNLLEEYAHKAIALWQKKGAPPDTNTSGTESGY